VVLELTRGAREPLGLWRIGLPHYRAAHGREPMAAQRARERAVRPLVARDRDAQRMGVHRRASHATRGARSSSARIASAPAWSSAWAAASPVAAGSRPSRRTRRGLRPEGANT